MEAPFLGSFLVLFFCSIVALLFRQFLTMGISQLRTRGNYRASEEEGSRVEREGGSRWKHAGLRGRLYININLQVVNFWHEAGSRVKRIMIKTPGKVGSERQHTHTHTHIKITPVALAYGPCTTPICLMIVETPVVRVNLVRGRKKDRGRVNEQERINGYSLLLTSSLSPSIVALSGAQNMQPQNAHMNQHTYTHAHLSEETIEDGKWVGCCQNGGLLFTNLIILFSSRWARWVITQPVYKSHGWCKIHTLVGWIIALGKYTPLALWQGHSSQ